MNPMDRFSALVAPVQDMQAVRDRRRTGVLYVDIPLDTARSLAGGTALVLPIIGTVIYVDQKENSGFAIVHVQDETFSIANTPVTVYPGFILEAPFTQLIVENEAQPGQTLRILYGVDIAFVPGSGAGVTVVNPVNVLDRIDPVCRTDRIDLATAVALNQVQTLLAPAANPRGVRLRHITQSTQAGAGGSVAQWVVAAATAPLGIGSLANSVQFGIHFTTSTTITQRELGNVNREVPPGWGVYAVWTINVAVATANVVYWSYEVL